MKFDKKIWKETDKEGGERHMMLDDLKNKYLDIGMRKDSVFAILGKPDSISKSAIYYLISVGFDPCFLELSFAGEHLMRFEEICN